MLWLKDLIKQKLVKRDIWTSVKRIKKSKNKNKQMLMDKLKIKY